MHVPATLRRTGYDLVPAAPRPNPGLCGLPLRQRRVIERFVSTMPARTIAEAMIEAAALGLDVDGLAAHLEILQSGLTPQLLRAAGGDRFPPRALRAVVV